MCFIFRLLFLGPNVALRLRWVKLSCPFRALRDWVVATAAPRVTRQDALEGEPAALEEAVFLDGFYAVVGASGRVATALAEPWR